MGTINAHIDSSDPKLVHIVPSGFQPGETSNINVRFMLSGFDDKIVTFSASDTVGGGTVVPPPVVNPGSVQVSVTSLTGYTDESKVINVTTPGTFTATCDNNNISLALDQVRRTITVTVPTNQQLTRQTGNITVSIDTYSDVIIPITLEAIDDITINGSPSGQQQYVNEPITLTVSGTTKNVTAISSSSDVVVVKTPGVDYTWTATANRPASNVQITFSGDGVKSRYKSYNFIAQEVPSIVLNPAQGPYKVGTQVEVNVTGITLYSGLNVTSSNSNLPISSGSGQGQYVLSINEAEETTITVSNRGVATKTLRVVGEELTTLIARPASLESAIGLDGRITISGNTGPIQVSSDNPDITARVEGSTIIVSCSTITTGTLTVTSDGCKDLEIAVTYADIVPIVGQLTPTTNTEYVGSKYTLVINGEIPGLTYSVSDPRLKVRMLSADPITYEISSDKGEGTSTINGSIDFTAPGRAPLSVPVDFLEITQFTVTDTEYNIKDTQLPLEITVDDLVGELTATINDPLTMDVTVEGNVVRVDSRAPLTSDRKFILTLHVDYLQDIQITINTSLDGVKVLPTMPCHGRVYASRTDETIYFNGPTVDGDDVLEVIVDNPLLKYRIDDINRIYVNTDQSCPPGRYKMIVKHNDYQDAEVYYVSEAIPVPPAPAPVIPEEHYDLGAAPSVIIATQPDTFVKTVFESNQLTDDNERLSFVIENGDGVLRDIANTFCSYNEQIGYSSGLPSSADGGRWNRRIYDQFLFVFGVSDYYLFRNYMRLIIKLMKHYRSNAFNTMAMMRFESGWVGTREELAKFRNISAFLNKYIDANGQNVQVSGLQVSGDGFKNMERYCGENIQP